MHSQVQGQERQSDQVFEGMTNPASWTLNMQMSEME